jgi:hypothetical protein
MGSLLIKIDEQTKYIIEVKEEYSVKEFINTFDDHLAKLKKISPADSMSQMVSATEKLGESFSDVKELFNQLSIYIEGLGDDITRKESAHMRTYTSISKLLKKRIGLVWLAPIGNSLRVYLRKGDYHNIDKQNRIVYSEPKKKTFGNYPTMKINSKQDIDYFFNIIKKIYES